MKWAQYAVFNSVVGPKKNTFDDAIFHIFAAQEQIDQWLMSMTKKPSNVD